MITKATFQQELRDVWNTAVTKLPAQAPFFSYEWHVLWHQILGSSFEPYPLIINERMVGPFARKGTALIFSGGEEISDYQDLICSPDHTVEAWQEIIPFVRSEGITSMHLRNIPETSPTARFFRSFPGATIQQEDTTPTMSLPDSWDAFVESLEHKARHELKRKIRKFERKHTNIRIVESKDPGRDIHILLSLMRKDKKKFEFLTPDMAMFFEKIAQTFASHISLLLLYMDDAPASATFSFIYHNASLLYNSGFDKTCCPNAGFYLKAMTIKHAIEKKLTTYNFLQGNERYKYELGGNNFFVSSISLTL